MSEGHICSNSACTVAENGRCVEGLELSQCPNYGRPLAPIDPSIEDASTPSEPLQELSQSHVLDAAECSRALAARSSRVVAVIGTFGAGKTSLIASIYDQFQRGPIGSVTFAGSSTLYSFEVACHDSRSASRREEAEMFRTPRGEARFYHIDVRRSETLDILSLMIADRAGEEYLFVASEAANAKGLFEVQRADTVTMLVDGARLADSVERHNVRAEIESIAQGMTDGGAFNGRQRLAVVLTKKDAVVASANRAKAEADFDRIVGSLKQKFSSRFHHVDSFQTTASPKNPGAVRGEGLPQLLKYWLNPVFVPPVKPLAIKPSRDFGRLREVDL